MTDPTDRDLKQGGSIMKQAAKMILWVVVVAVLVLAVVCTVRRRCMTACTPETPVVATEPAAEEPVLSGVEERMADPVYVEALKALTVERRGKAGEAHAIRVKMDARVAAAAAELKAEAGTAAVTAAASPAAGSDVGALQDEALRERLSRDPEWVALEAEQAAVQRALLDIQGRVAVLIRERMKAQAARRPAKAEGSTVRPAAVNHVTNSPVLMQPEPVVITNVPGVRVEVPGGTGSTPSAEDEPGGTGSTPSAEDEPGGTGSTPSAEDEPDAQTPIQASGSPQVRPPDGE